MCGNQILKWRQRAGVSREQLAAESGYAVGTIKQMEQGRRRPSYHLLCVADQLCGADGMLIGLEVYLEPEKFASFSLEFIGAEATARVLNWFEGLLIPGLLQTEEIARALIREDWPPLDDKEFEESVKGRIERQGILVDLTKSFNFCVGMAVLDNVVGTKEEFRRQLLHMAEMAERRNITVQVVPHGCVHPGLTGAFVLLETPEHAKAVYLEVQGTGQMFSDPETVSNLSHRYEMILRRALSPEESVRVIRKLAEEL
jgi:transcriptional regulator with XRE-family HTH domain